MVRIRPRTQQLPVNVDIDLVAASQAEGRLLQHVAAVDLGPSREQLPDALALVELDGDVKRRVACCRGFGVEVGAVADVGG